MLEERTADESKGERERERGAARRCDERSMRLLTQAVSTLERGGELEVGEETKREKDRHAEGDRPMRREHSKG